MTQGGEISRREGCPKFDGVKIFSATKARERENLDYVITSWLNKNPHVTPVDYSLTQSSDSEFHCVVFAVFYIVPPNGDAVDALKKPSRSQSNSAHRR